MCRQSLPTDQETEHEAAMMESICVITPCFNAAPFLKICLKSVAAQGDCVLKHIVMDGGSTDGSVEILKNFGNNNSKLSWRSEPDRGQSDALNKALELVDTRYFAWLNADDCYMPAKLGALLLAAQSVPAPAIVYGDYQVINASGELVKRRRQPSFNYWDCLYSYLTVQNCAAIFRTDLCRSTGGFDRHLAFCMDYDLILRLAGAGPVRHVREYVGCFRHHEGAKTSRLQEVCENETTQLRLQISGRSPQSLRWRSWLGKIRVAARMLAEGCLGSRLRKSYALGDMRS
jgi:glycosyltransferase involved in cell wall biosynthesis